MIKEIQTDITNRKERIKGLSKQEKLKEQGDLFIDLKTYLEDQKLDDEKIKNDEKLKIFKESLEQDFIEAENLLHSLEEEERVAEAERLAEEEERLLNKQDLLKKQKKRLWSKQE